LIKFKAKNYNLLIEGLVTNEVKSVKN